MQDRHAGDVSDFFKLGLLRWLVAPSPYAHRLRLGVIWFRVADEHADADDRQLAYLDRSSAVGQDLRPLDASLYDVSGAWWRRVTGRSEHWCHRASCPPTPSPTTGS
jgi:hypothetical protein